MTIDEALEYLRGLNQFRLLIQDIEADREDAISAQCAASDPNELLKGAGRLETVNMLLNKMRGT